jgi:hypothetical protein
MATWDLIVVKSYWLNESIQQAIYSIQHMNRDGFHDVMRETVGAEFGCRLRRLLLFQKRLVQLWPSL